MPATRVFIIDDCLQVCSACRQILEVWGFVAGTHLTAEHAFDAVAKFSPDIIILDIDMQGGRDLLEQLKSSPQLDGLPIILWSGIPKPGSKVPESNPFSDKLTEADDPVEPCFYLGHRFLLKPVRMSFVKDLIQKAVD